MRTAGSRALALCAAWLIGALIMACSALQDPIIGAWRPAIDENAQGAAGTYEWAGTGIRFEFLSDGTVLCTGTCILGTGEWSAVNGGRYSVRFPYSTFVARIQNDRLLMAPSSADLDAGRAEPLVRVGSLQTRPGQQNNVTTVPPEPATIEPRREVQTPRSMSGFVGPIECTVDHNASTDAEGVSDVTFVASGQFCINERTLYAPMGDGARYRRVILLGQERAIDVFTIVPDSGEFRRERYPLNDNTFLQANEVMASSGVGRGCTDEGPSEAVERRNEALMQFTQDEAVQIVVWRCVPQRP